MAQFDSPPPQWLKILILIAIGFGLVFRFIHLDQKPYWHDETYTSIRISGQLAADAVQTLFTGQVLDLEAFRPFQSFNPERSIADMVHSLATEDPHHPPLSYLLQRPWVSWVGSSVWGMRSLPALLSLLQFPTLFWFCRTVFQSTQVAWIALGLFAVSPIYVRYAQEARQYSLWITLMILSSGLLFLAVQSPRKWRYWVGYSLVTSLGLYCHIFHGFVLAGQVLYGAAIALRDPWRGLAPWRWTPLLTGFSAALSVSLLAFSPWIWVIVTHWQRLMVTTDWAKQALPLGALLKIWSLHLCHALFSWNPQYDDGLMYLGIPILGLVAIALYRLCRTTSPQVWLMPLSLMGVPFVVLAIPDLLWGGQRSVSDRYFFPTYLGLAIALFYFLGTQFSRHRFWQIITVSLLLSGIVSCAFNAQAETWWRWSEYDVESGRIINQSSQPLVISDMPLGEVLALSYQLKPTAQMLLLNDPQTLTIPTHQDLFFFNPSEALRTQANSHHHALELVYQFRENLLVISLYRSHPILLPAVP